MFGFNPIQSLADLVKSPFRALGGMARDIVGSLGLGAMFTAVIMGVKTLAPELWFGIQKTFKGQEWASAKSVDMDKKADVGFVADSAIAGFGAAAAFAGAKGALREGGLPGGLLVMGTVAAVTIGAITKNDVKLADSAAGPAPLPTGAGAPKAKTEQAKG